MCSPPGLPSQKGRAKVTPTAAWDGRGKENRIEGLCSLPSCLAPRNYKSHSHFKRQFPTCSGHPQKQGPRMAEWEACTGTYSLAPFIPKIKGLPDTGDPTEPL